jgi:PPM family protein phosphatase
MNRLDGQVVARITNVRPGLEIANLTDVGCQRENNEDSYAYWEAEDDAQFERLGRLAIVADGMGGCEGGQHASRIAVETVLDSYRNAASVEDPQQRLLDAFTDANARVQQMSLENPSLRGMGTTLTVFAVVDHHLYYAHVGDSRLYLLRDSQLRLLTHDHSLVARLVENGIVRAEDAESHPQKHVLTAAIGVAEAVEPDVPAEPLTLESEDVLLLCTDGLWGQINEQEITRILSASAPAPGCGALVDLAKERGGPDNITVQIARIG